MNNNTNEEEKEEELELELEELENNMINIDLTTLLGLVSSEEVFLDLLIEGNNFDQDMSDIDDRLYDDQKVEVGVPIADTSIRFSVPSITKIIKRSGIIDDKGIPKGINNNAAEYLSNLAYTRLQKILTKALIVLDERGGKILTFEDIVHTLQLMGENIIHPYIKS